KALEKDRNRRYASALDLAGDIRRHLRHEPVQACPPSALYRMRSFARRNKARLRIAGLVLFTLLFVGGAAVWVMRDRAIRWAAAEQEVQQALDEAAALQSQGKWPEAVEAVKRAQGFLAGGGSGQLRERVREMHDDLEMVLHLEKLRFPAAICGTEGPYDE